MASRPFITLYIAVFVATLGISMVSPLLGVFAEELGASGIGIALTFSIFAPMQAIMGPFAGKLSDRYGRKWFIIAGLAAYFLAALGYLTASTFLQVIFFRALSGLGTSFIFSVGRAYIGDMVPPGKEGRWFGVFATADILGFGTGPLIAGTVRQTVGFDAVFLTMAALLAASAAIVFVLLPKAPDVIYRLSEEEGGGREVGVLRALRQRLVVGVTLNQAVASLAYGSLFSFLAIKLEDNLLVAPFVVGLVFSLQNITSAFAQPVLGRVADSADRRYLLGAGVTISGFGLIAAGFATTLWQIVIIMLAMGFSNAISQVSSSAIQVYVGRRVGMGTVLGLGAAGGGWGIFFGSLAGGAFVEWANNVDAAFYLGGALMLSGVPLFLWLTRGLRTSEVLAAQDEGHIPRSPVVATPGVPATVGAAPRGEHD